MKKNLLLNLMYLGTHTDTEGEKHMNRIKKEHKTLEALQKSVDTINILFI